LLIRAETELEAAQFRMQLNSVALLFATFFVGAFLVAFAAAFFAGAAFGVVPAIKRLSVVTLFSLELR